jgi:hypothetical protein
MPKWGPWGAPQRRGGAAPTQQARAPAPHAAKQRLTLCLSSTPEHSCACRSCCEGGTWSPCIVLSGHATDFAPICNSLTIGLRRFPIDSVMLWMVILRILMGARQKIWAKNSRLELIRSLGNCCQICGSVEHLELHIDGDGPPQHHGLDASSRICVYRRMWRIGRLRLWCARCHHAQHSIKKNGTISTVLIGGVNKLLPDAQTPRGNIEK